jgi:hypothetical protein
MTKPNKPTSRAVPGDWFQSAPKTLQGPQQADIGSLPRASAFRASVERMVTMLEEGEWAEHVAATTGKGDPLAQRLEDTITNLINEAGGNAGGEHGQQDHQVDCHSEDSD